MMKRLLLKQVSLISLLVVFDQLTKHWLRLRETGAVLFQADHFNLTLQSSLNRDFAFSLPAPWWVIIPVILGLFVFVCTLWIRALKTGNHQVIWLSLIVAGALGNLIDRFIFGGVIDWIEMRLVGLSWSSFNFADIYIVLGILGWLLSRPNSEKSLPSSL